MHIFNMLLPKLFSCLLKSYAHLQYAYNICEKFQIDCLKTVGGVDYTNSHAHPEYADNICAKFQIDCLKTLGGVDYTNLLSNIEA